MNVPLERQRQNGSLYQVKKSFKSLLEINKSVTILVKAYIVTEIYKLKNDISSDVMEDIFTFQESNNYTLKSRI